MPTPQQASYAPTQVTQSQAALPRWLTQELNKISKSITTLIQTLSGKVPLGVYTVAGLPTGVAAGVLANVSDGTAALTWGTAVTGGGSTSYLVRYNGSAWTVVGK